MSRIPNREFNFKTYKRSEIQIEGQNFQNKSDVLSIFMNEVKKLLVETETSENKIKIINQLFLSIKNAINNDKNDLAEIDATVVISQRLTNSVHYLCGNEGYFSCTHQKVTRGTINMLYYLWSEYRKITQQFITTDNYSQFTEWLGLSEYNFPMEAILNQSKPKEYFNSISISKIKISANANALPEKAEILDFGFKTGYAAANQFNYIIDQSVSAVSKNSSNSQQIVCKNINNLNAQVNAVQQNAVQQEAPIVLKRNENNSSYKESLPLPEYPKKYFESERKNLQYLIKYLLNTLLIKYIAEKPKLLLFIRTMSQKEIISAIIMIKKYSEKNKQISLRTVIYILKINHMMNEESLVWKENDSKKVKDRKITEIMYKHMIAIPESVTLAREERDSVKSMLTREIQTLTDVEEYYNNPETFFNKKETEDLFKQVTSVRQLKIEADQNTIQISYKDRCNFVSTELSSRAGLNELRGENLISRFQNHMEINPNSNLYDMLTKTSCLSDKEFKNIASVKMLYAGAVSSLDAHEKDLIKISSFFKSRVLNRFIVYIDGS